VPHRYWADEPEKHGVNQMRVIGAVNEASLKAGLKLYQNVFGIPLHTCPTVEIAEMCKITEKQPPLPANRIRRRPQNALRENWHEL